MQEIILGVMANILRTYAIYRFMEVMNPLKTVSRRLKILMYSGFVVLTSGGYYLFHNQIINIMTNLTGLMLILLIYKESLEKKIVFAIGIYSINVVIESLVFSATGLYKDYDEMTRSIKECITSLGIYFCVFLLERTCFKKERQFPIRTSLWVMMLSVPAFSIIEVFCMWQANYNNKRLISMEIIGILITNIAIFYLYDALQDYYEQKSEKEKLAFVGDGINDAPVLSRADIGIAKGALGSDAAIEAADVVLMDDDPKKIVKAIKISRKCMRIVYENIYFALGIKAICLVLGALGIANMWMAIFADVGVMVIAVLNAIRALFVKNL